MNLSNARLIDESFEDYKARQKQNNAAVKLHLKGRMIWNSTQKGTAMRTDKGYRKCN